jgi:cytochrome b561
MARRATMGDMDNEAADYTRTAVALHWLTALLIVAGFAIGLYAVDLKLSPTKLKLYAWHKWIGVTVFGLALARLAWRWRHPAPPLPLTMPRWERGLAHGTHAAIYVLLLALPISGWLMSSASGVPVVYLGVLPLPDLVAKDKALADALKLVHYALNKTLLALVVLHVAAALKHHLLERDRVLRRMLAWHRPPPPAGA